MRTRTPTPFRLLVSCLLPLLSVSLIEAADVVALCIGNDAYVRAEDVLDTPIADATLMKQTFESLPGGADVVLLTNADRESIVIALNSLILRSRGAKLVVVYYSGHGLEGQPDGFNKADTFLLPVDAEIPDVNYLTTRAVGLQVVLDALQNCPVTARAVILDCCRSGAPKATSALKGATKSFGDIDEAVKTALGASVVPEATLIAFAASPGRKAAAFLKQSDVNSPFTKFLSESLKSGTGNLRDLVEVAAEKTEVATGKRQVPYVTYTGAASAIRQIVFRVDPSPIPPVVVKPTNELKSSKADEPQSVGLPMQALPTTQIATPATIIPQTAAGGHPAVARPETAKISDDILRSPAPGSPDRVAIAEILREKLMQEPGMVKRSRKILFFDVELKTQSGWACFCGTPQYTDSGSGSIEISVLALLKMGATGRWTPVKVLYLSDVPSRKELVGNQKVPAGILPTWLEN